MTDFAHTFLLLFGQLAFGGVFALSVPGFHEIERGFFKSTACVYLGCGLIICIGKLSLAYSAPPETFWKIRTFEVSLWLLFCGLCGLYTYTLWGDRFVLRARAYLFSLLSGLIALSFSASVYRTAPFFFSRDARLSTQFSDLGPDAGREVATGMSLGHWYLIELDLSLDPFRRIFKFYAGTIVVHLVTLTLGLGLLLLSSHTATGTSVRGLWTDHQTLLWMRLGLGPLASLGIAYMIWRTLQIPQTMAATGLFYVAILAASCGGIF